MYISFDELREIKHKLPHGGIKRIADELNLDEETVRNYFGAHHLANSGNHIQPGPNGGKLKYFSLQRESKILPYLKLI